MKYVPTKVSLFLIVVVALVGCADPAKGKPQAEVGAAKQTGGSTESGERYVLGEGSSIGFVGSKVTGKHEGGFDQFEGEILLVDGDPSRSSVRVLIDTRSLWSDNDRLTGHLRSEDFFAVDAHRTAEFESTSIEAGADGYLVTGNLDLRGVTKSITFPATISVQDASVTASAEFAIKRFDWNIVYKGKADDLIRDDVVIQFELVASPAG